MGGAVENVGNAIGDVVEGTVDAISDAGSSIDDFVNEEIPGGWYTVGAVAGGAALANAGAAAGASGAAGGAAGGTGLTAGAAGVTGLTPGAAGVTGLTAGSSSLGGAIGAGIGTVGAAELASASGSSAGMEGALGTGLNPAATGEGFTAIGSGAPEISSMGGGSGLLTPGAAGGTVGATGVTSAGAVPMLGEAGSMINNPAVLGTDVIGVNPSAGMSIRDIMNAARLGNTVYSLLNQPKPQPQQQGFMQNRGAGAVDYSQTLNLLATRPQFRRNTLI
jgi:hypothetical protein